MRKSNNNTLKNIVIRNAHLHNLKNISLKIPKNKFVVISGVSGSGKSTLAFDTLFAEGQRRYIESLSSYARQFLGKLKKPDVEEIKGICPAIAIEQKVISKNPRSTIGTSTEIYDYFKILFTRLGKTYSPISGKEVKRCQISDICDFILRQETKTRILILVKYTEKNNEKNMLLNLIQKGFSRVMISGEIFKINQLIKKTQFNHRRKIKIVVDRIIIDHNQINKKRITDSIETAYSEGDGECLIEINGLQYSFSNKFKENNMVFESPSIHFFSFNNPYGACDQCNSYGSIIGIDKNKVITNNQLSVTNGVVNCWSGEKLNKWKERFILNSEKYNFPIDSSYNQLSNEEKDLLWKGKGKCKGVFQFFNTLQKKKYKIQNRVLIARYSGKTRCSSCNGDRIRKDALYVKIGGKNIAEICEMNIETALNFFNKITFDKNDEIIAKRILNEIISRLNYLYEVGLGYLTINRESSTLSGGESQRINLAKSLGSPLVGSMYILDEPSIGLHPKDIESLIKVLKNLRDIGNTVIVVEHEEKIMEQADQVIDLGPKAGIEGGKVIFQGTLKEIYKNKNSLTTKYLSHQLTIPIPKNRNQWNHSIKLFEIFKYNLRKLDVEIPLNCFVLITGVSGSGKSTLVKDVLKPALEDHLGFYKKNHPNLKKISISNKEIKKIELIDQNPVGKSSRSNPATYLKIYDDVRLLFSKQNLSRIRKYSPSSFSFNVEGGRCELCKGDGEITVEMQFMADVHLECEQCKGQRFKKEVLEVEFNRKNIALILDLSVNEAIEFFKKNNEKSIVKKLIPLTKVGLGYIKLGQSSNTLSGGEAQRIKLASFLAKGIKTEETLFIFDEPTTGLHFHDINKLLNSFYALINKGHSIICIEHNVDVIKCADWVIDLGPGGGENGGKLIFSGTPEDLITCKKSITGKYLKGKLNSIYSPNSLVE